MQLLGDIIISVLSVYLAFTNSIADRLVPYLTDAAATTTTVEDTVDIQSVDSDYDEQALIPRILLENAEFQKAAVIDGVLTPSEPAAPLEALVNVFCTFTTDRYERSTTGSGFFVHEDGVILTNAHVAQFLLLNEVESGTGDCVIRTGTPATATYETELLYISPAWVQENAGQLREEVPSGTGERDYALLYVTERVDGELMPARFPAVSVDTRLLSLRTVEEPVRAAGYPAQVLAEQGVDSPLRGIEVGTRIREVLTFGSNYVDLFTIAGTEIGQQGSSGGPVANADGSAIGLITTRGDDTRFGTGSLRAISISYIDRTIMEETGYGLLANLGGNLPYRADLFQRTIGPFLSFILERNME